MATIKTPQKKATMMAADKNAAPKAAPVKKAATTDKAQETKSATKTVIRNPKVTPQEVKIPAKQAAAPQPVQQEQTPIVLQSFEGKWGEIRQLLLNLKEQTLLEIKRSIKKGSEAAVGEETTGDIYDQASSERDRELGLLLNDREREKLHNIDEALLRIAEDEYGICEECDEDIPLGRLKVLPFTRHCVKCKSELEKVQAQTRRIEEDRVYREIPVGDEEEG